MIIEAAAERIKDFFYEMIEGMEMENIVNSYIFRNLYKGLLATRSEHPSRSQMLLGLGLKSIENKSAEEYFPFPDHLSSGGISDILHKENPNNLNDEIEKECKRMFYFIKDLYEGKLDGVSPEMQKTAISNIETFNQLLAGYDGPKPEDSFEGKNLQ